MRHAQSGLILALLLTGVGVAAQGAKTTTGTKVTSDNGTVVTMTGCVMIGGSTNYLLANITSEKDQHDKVASPGHGSYALVEREGFDLSPFINQRVELTGVVVPAATKGDHDDKIKIKDKKAASSTTVKVARGTTGQFLVASVKPVAPTCGS